jgi:hypothetical protein
MKTNLNRVLFLFAVIGFLSGCSVSQVIDEKNPDERVGGYKVTVSDYSKIKADDVNLKFEVAQNAPVGEFDWKDVQSSAIDLIKEKGIKISDDGKPVTVVFDGFVGWDRSQFPARKSFGSGIAGGSVLAAGGSILQGVAASLIESQVTYEADKNKKAELVCDSDCVPEAGFSVLSEGYESNVNLMHSQGFANYVSMTEKMVARGIADLFEPLANKER